MLHMILYGYYWYLHLAYETVRILLISASCIWNSTDITDICILHMKQFGAEACFIKNLSNNNLPAVTYIWAPNCSTVPVSYRSGDRKRKLWFQTL
jgi:hypothetical protein